MTTEFVEMSDGKRVSVTYWDNTDSPRAAVVMVHGMCEYIARYDDFCGFLGCNGYNVIGMDNRAFGDTDPDRRGKGVPGMFEKTVDDIKTEADIARKRWGVERVYVIGHSYGSFLTQRFIEKYGDSVSGAVLCGSALQSGIMLSVGKKMARRQAKKDPDSPGKTFARLTFENYDKKFGEGENAWINRDKSEVEKYNADEKCAGVGICSAMFYKELFEGIDRTNKERDKVPPGFKLMIASGDADGVGGFGKLVVKLDKAYRKKSGIIPRLKLYPGARHEILNELNKGEVYEDFVEFLDTCEDFAQLADDSESASTEA